MTIRRLPRLPDDGYPFSPAIGEVAVLRTVPALERRVAELTAELAEVTAAERAERAGRERAEARADELASRIAAMAHGGQIARPGW